MRKWLNQLFHTHILCVEQDQLILLKKGTSPVYAQELEELSLSAGQPLIVVINPLQFLQLQQHLSHLYLTDWQKAILEQLTDSLYIIRSLLFLPQLLEKGKKEEIHTIEFLGQTYLYVCQKGITFWNNSQNNTPLLAQIEAVRIYLKRYQVDISSASFLKPPLLFTPKDLIDPALQKKGYNGPNDEFPSIRNLLSKRAQTQKFMRINVLYLILSLMFILTGGYFAISCGQTLISYNPWALPPVVEKLSDSEEKDLKNFENFLAFYHRSPLFRDKMLKHLFQQFAGKIVGTDLMWQEGKWTVSFILDPVFGVEAEKLRQWVAHHLYNSQLFESETTPHHYTLHFEEKAKTDEK